MGERIYLFGWIAVLCTALLMTAAPELRSRAVLNWAYGVMAVAMIIRYYRSGHLTKTFREVASAPPKMSPWEALGCVVPVVLMPFL